MSAWLTSAPLSTRNCTTSMFSSMHACKRGGWGGQGAPKDPTKAPIKTQNPNVLREPHEDLKPKEPRRTPKSSDLPPRNRQT